MSTSVSQDAVDDPETGELFVESWPKVCACGNTITEDQWDGLRYVGVQRIPADYGLPDMELRNCPCCGSTLAIVVPSDYS